MKRIMIIAVGAILVGLVVAASLALSPGTETITSDALGVDAQAYASDYNVTVEEARRRLTLQGSVGPIQKDLIDNESDTFAGLWIQHEPTHRIIARFTREGEATIRPYVTGGPLAGLVDVRTADATLNELKAAQNSAMTKSRDVSVPVESEIDVIGNRVKLFVVDKAGLESALTEAGEQLPNKVDVVKVDELSTVTADLHAGLSTSPCTAGYSVVHSDGRDGITTAAHCEPAISFGGTALTYVQGYLGGNYDVQWHEEAPTHTLRGLIFDGTFFRYVHGTKHRDDQAVGEYVCRYGKMTFYACGDIASTHVQPDTIAGVEHTGCENTPCEFSATFIRVNRTLGLESVDGDSGGPWFSNNTAYGIHRGHAPNGETYMAINYISGLGLSVITE